MPINRNDLLRQAGYNDQGAITQVVRLSTSTRSTTSGGFVTAANSDELTQMDLSVVPDSATLIGRVIVETAGTMGTDGDYRFLIQAQRGGQNVQGQTLTISQGRTFVSASSAGTAIPLREIVRVRFQLRADGTNTVSAFNVAFQLEIEL